MLQVIQVWHLYMYMSFLLRSVYDTLPSPANLHTWGLREDPSCHLCGGRGTTAHILSGCKTALQQGRYRWRHYQVLAVLADSIEKERKRKRAVGGGSSTLYSFWRPDKHRRLHREGSWDFSTKQHHGRWRPIWGRSSSSQMWFRPALDPTSCYGRKSAGKSSWSNWLYPGRMLARRPMREECQICSVGRLLQTERMECLGSSNRVGGQSFPSTVNLENVPEDWHDRKQEEGSYQTPCWCCREGIVFYYALV